MGVTKFDKLNATQSRIYVATSLPTTAAEYWGAASNDVDSIEWHGGEMAYLTNIHKLFIQVATSGATASWYRYQDVITSTTTSTSTSSSSSSSTTSSTTTP